MADMDKLKAKIRALRDKTMAAGCTEAEALAAAEVAARLMAEAGLSEADIEITAARARETTSRTTWRTHIAVSVMHATNTAAVQRSDVMEFLGGGPWPEVAAYLYQVLTGAVKREQARFKASPEYLRRRTVKTRRAALADFAAGMVARLRRRLLDMFAATIDPDLAEASQQALSAQYPGATDRQWTAGKPRYAEAQAAGYAAGGNVTLAHGVAGPDGAPLAIEGPR